VVFLQSEIKRGFLRQIAAGAKATASLLGDALLGFQSAIYTPNFQRGKLLISTSGSGQSGSFEIGVAGKQFTQETIFGLSELLLQIHSETVSASVPDDGTPEATDALRDAMLQDVRLQSVRTAGGDFTLIGLPGQGTVNYGS